MRLATGLLASKRPHQTAAMQEAASPKGLAASSFIANSACCDEISGYFVLEIHASSAQVAIVSYSHSIVNKNKKPFIYKHLKIQIEAMP